MPTEETLKSSWKEVPRPSSPKKSTEPQGVPKIVRQLPHKESLTRTNDTIKFKLQENSLTTSAAYLL